MKTKTISEVFGLPEGSFLKLIVERKAKEDQEAIEQRIFIRQASEARKNGTYDEFIKLNLQASSTQKTPLS